MATWGKIYSAMLEAAGEDLSSTEAQDLLQSEEATQEIQGPFLKSFKDRFMTFEDAKNRPGLKDYFTKRQHADYSRMQEQWLTKIANDLKLGIDDPEAFYRENSDHRVRLEKIIQMAREKGLEAGKTEAGNNPKSSEEVQKIKAELSAKIDEINDLKSRNAMERDQIKSSYESKVNQLSREIQDRDLSGFIQKNLNLDFSIPGIDYAIKGKIQELRDKYHITQDMKVAQLEHPDKVATDDNGQPLKLEQVLSSLIGEEFMKKKPDQDGGGGAQGGRRPITGQGDDTGRPTPINAVDLDRALSGSLQALNGGK